AWRGLTSAPFRRPHQGPELPQSGTARPGTGRTPRRAGSPRATGESTPPQRPDSPPRGSGREPPSLGARWIRGWRKADAPYPRDRRRAGYPDPSRTVTTLV